MQISKFRFVEVCLKSRILENQSSQCDSQNFPKAQIFNFAHLQWDFEIRDNGRIQNAFEKRKKQQKSLFFKFKLQCDFHNYETYVLSQGVFCFLRFS